MSKLAIVLCTILFASTITSGSNDPRADVCAEENKVQFDLSYAEIPYINKSINCTLPYKRLVVTRVFSKTKNGYVDALMIPERAENIFVKETFMSNPDLGYSNTQHNVFLNRCMDVGFNGAKQFAGTLFDYSWERNKSHTSVTIKSTRPTGAITYVGLFSEGIAVTVLYEYSLRGSFDNYTWVVKQFSANFSSDGPRSSKINCVRRQDYEAADVYMCGVIDNENCNASYFSCCPDNTTARRGYNNNGGCRCDTSQFGCCADGVTIAKGPHSQGCKAREPTGVAKPIAVIISTNKTEYAEGSEVRFSCSAQDEPDLTIMWYKDELEINPDKRIKFFESSNTLLITNGTSSDSGSYSCGALDNDMIIATSIPINISVNDVHQYDDIDKDNRTASHFGSNSDGRHIIHSDPGANCSIQGDKQTCANITDVWFFDTKYDICARSYYGGCGGKGNNFRTEEECKTNCVESKEVPVAVRFPTRQTEFTEGSEFRIPCPVAGDSSPQFSWYKDEKLIFTDDRIKIFESDTLVITNAVSEDSGSYACRLSKGQSYTSIITDIRVIEK